MLETPQERVKLLKAGVDAKTIEILYIIYLDIVTLATLSYFDSLPKYGEYILRDFSNS